MGDVSLVATKPARPGSRPCCIFAPRIENRKFETMDRIFDDTVSGAVDQHYGGNEPSYGIGIAYSCKGGFLDLGHMRDLIDLTKGLSVINVSV